MKELLIYILKQIVDHVEDVDVTETSEGDHINLTIHANQEDLGKIIGRGGRIIRAIRDIIKILAAKEAKYVDVEIAEDKQPELNNEPAK